MKSGNMKAEGHIHLIMYDITHDRALQKVARLMEKNGYERLNYSVWYGLADPVRNVELSGRLKKLLNTEEALGSRMYFLKISLKDFEKMRTFDGKKIKEMEYWTGRLKTMFI